MSLRPSLQEARRNRLRQRRRTGPDGQPDAGHDAGLNGIDYLEVELGETGEPPVLRVHCLFPVAPSPGPHNVSITGGVRIRGLRVVRVMTEGQVLTVHVDRAGDQSTYTLHLRGPQKEPFTHFDPYLATLEFSFHVDEESRFDCEARAPLPASVPAPAPVIDHLAKDYASFRSLMLDRLSLVLPRWSERNPADAGVAVVEMLALVADHLSYYQDAVATEAYLGTARRRVSVRRHARLLDYFLHEGCNARAWVCFEVTQAVSLPRGTPLYTDARSADGEGSPGAPVFETLEGAPLDPARNRLRLYTWSEEPCSLPRGATRATLQDPGRTLELRQGDVLLFEEVGLGPADVPDPAHRHAVRLLTVRKTHDALAPTFGPDLGGTDADGLDLLEIEWHPEDALPFALPLQPHQPQGSPDRTDQTQRAAGLDTVVLGNVVLADQGRTIGKGGAGGAGGDGVGNGSRVLAPPEAPREGRYRPRLLGRNLTFYVPYDPERAREQSASAALQQDPRAALPAIELDERDERWTARRDLLGSDRFGRDFVVETENDGGIWLRFGDGMAGRAPASGARFGVSYRSGNGPAGNVSSDKITYLDPAFLLTRTPRIEPGWITAVRNPLPAQGGTEAESIESARLAAPHEFRDLARAVTPEDYVALAERHPEVQKAAVSLRWTGSWYVVFLVIDRRGGRPVDAAFRQTLRDYLEPSRLLGHEIEIERARLSPLRIAMRIRLARDYVWDDVSDALYERFSSGERSEAAGGGRGFFHPDNFTFGQPLYASQVTLEAMRIPGVQSVRLVQFDRADHGASPGGTPGDEVPTVREVILCSPFEIVSLANDPAVPEHGQITFEEEERTGDERSSF